MSIIIGRSVRGASHIHRATPCEDWHTIYQISDPSGKYDIIAVADGHGSDKYPYSGDGSRLATHTFCEYMSQYCAAYEPEQLRQYLHVKTNQINIAQHLMIEWQKAVCDFHQLEEREPASKSEGDAFNPEIYSQYGTTLLGLMVAPTFTYVFQLGDGDITYVNEETAHAAIEGDHLLGVETYSLSQPAAWEKSHSTVINGVVDRPCMYLLSTDGLKNSYPTNEDFYEMCRRNYELFAQGKSKIIGEDLTDWLTNVSTKGSGDDITAVFVYYDDSDGANKEG